MSKSGYMSYCWRCKKPVGGLYDGNNRCLSCGWFICSCGACSASCEFNRHHWGEEYDKLREKKRIKEEHDKMHAHQMAEERKKTAVNSVSGNVAKYGIRLATWAAVLGAATVATVVGAVPYLIDSESKTNKKIDDALDKVTDKIEEVGFSAATKTGRAIDKLLKKDEYY